MDKIERRRFKRFDFHQEMQLYLVDFDCQVSGLDISREGVGFQWSEPMEVGSNIDVIISFSDTFKMQLLLNVVVCRKAEDGFIIGSTMQSEDADLLEKLIATFNEED